MHLNQLIIITIFLLRLSVKCEENENKTDMSVAEENLKGRRYFIQYRKLGDGDLYINVKKNFFIPKTITRRLNYDYSSFEDTIPSNFKISQEISMQKRYKHLLDKEWHVDMKKRNFETPEIIQELYKLMKNGEVESIHGASVIKCLFEIEYEKNDSKVFRFELGSLKNIEGYDIVDAEFHLFRLNENTTKDYNQDYLIRLYQMLPANETEKFNGTIADMHKLLSVLYISSTYKGWQTFKAGAALTSWLNGEENLGFMLTAADLWENPMPLSYATFDEHLGELRPVLTIYMKKTNERNNPTEKHELQVQQKHVKPFTYFPMSFVHKSEVPCSRHIWYVNFQDIGLENTVVAPKGYMAYLCKGSCKHKTQEDYTNHGKIKNMFQYIDKRIDAPICVPTSFKPLVIMFFDHFENIVIKKYEDMIVEKCGCR